MAVTNTGVVLRTITGVNESDLFLDSEATSVTTNTGVVERSIVGVHDANFVRPIGDEDITNGDFSNGATDWNFSGTWAISNGIATSIADSSTQYLGQDFSINIGASYKITYNILENTLNNNRVLMSGTSAFNSTQIPSNIGVNSIVLEATGVASSGYSLRFANSGTNNSGVLSITNISVKELLVNRESNTTNTGIVERAITGLNESELWLDAESTSVVNNTGIVERPITGVNVSDALFPDNTDSTVVNISDTIIPLLTALEARATTFENREGTQNILINIQKC